MAKKKADPKIHVLTAEEIEVMNRGKKDPNALFDYFFRREGSVFPFQFDRNFAPGKEWQNQFVMALQTFIVVVGGIGTGKTLAAGIGGFFHGMTTPGFKFLNIAKESWQSMLMYNLILEIIAGTPAEKFVFSKPRRPYPKIVIKYQVGNRIVESSLEFMSIGEQGNASNVFSWRGDWINIEEAGRIDNLSQIVTNLSTRLTGNTAEGRPYMGRMSLLSNPWENPELWQMLDVAAADKKNGLALEVYTEDNKNVTEQQLENMLKLIPEKEREKFTTGKRPDGTGTYFPKDIVEPCEDLVTSELLLQEVAEGRPGYVAEMKTRVGYWHVELPPQEGRVYFLLGDPGAGTAPARNAPTWMVFDVTDAPKIVTLRALWWGDGKGSISPFIQHGIHWIQKYSPILAGIDDTATQRNMAEIINMEYITGKGYSVDRIRGFGFEGGKRYTYLVCLKIMLEAQAMKWPKVINGISAQLRNYDDLKDKAAASKLAQDLVVTMAMAAYAVRSIYGFIFAKEGQEDTPSDTPAEFERRASRSEAPTRDSRIVTARSTSR